MYQAGTVTELLHAQRSARSRGFARAVTRNVLFLGLTSLVTDVSAEMVSTILPLYVLYNLELSLLSFGVIDGLHQGAAAVVRIVMGFLADRSGRIKEIAAGGYALSALCKLGLVAAGGSAAGIAGVVFLDRTGKGMRTAPRDALISLSAPPDALGTAFGVHRALDTAGAMLGPLLAWGLLSLVPGGFDVVFVVSFCIAIIGVALIAFFVDGRPPSVATIAAEGVQAEGEGARPAQPRRISLRDIVQLVRMPRFSVIIATTTLLSAVTLSDALVYVTLQRRMGFEPTRLPLLYVASAVVFMLLAVPMGLLADRVGRKRVFLGGYVALAALYGLLLFGGKGWLTVAACVGLFGAAHAATDGVLAALASRVLPAEVRTSGLAVLTTCSDVARGVASVVFGAVWAGWNAERALWLFLAGLTVALVAAAVVWVAPREENLSDVG